MSLQTAIAPSVEIPACFKQLMSEILMIVSSEQMKIFLDFMVALSTGYNLYAENELLCNELYGILPYQFKDRFNKMVYVYIKHYAQENLQYAIEWGNEEIAEFLVNNRDVKIDTTMLQKCANEKVKNVLKAQLTAKEIGLFQ